MHDEIQYITQQVLESCLFLVFFFFLFFCTEVLRAAAKAVFISGSFSFDGFAVLLGRQQVRDKQNVRGL